MERQRPWNSELYARHLESRDASDALFVEKYQQRHPRDESRVDAAIWLADSISVGLVASLDPNQRETWISWLPRGLKAGQALANGNWEPTRALMLEEARSQHMASAVLPEAIPGSEPHAKESEQLATALINCASGLV